MEFKKYQHLEKFGATETNGIEYGTCYVFPKIDGSNAQIFYNNGLQAGSRNRHLKIDNDNAGFLKWVLQQQKFELFFKKYPNIRLYGEWLVPHILKTYIPESWNYFYVFDVMENDNYIDYETYKIMLEEYNIEYIPPICKIKNPTYQRLIDLLDKNNYLIQDGKGTGEGIVIKNYEFKNKYGNIVWAKIVKNEFKAKHSRVQITEIKEKKIIEQDIADKFVTKVLIEKEYAKINNEAGWSSRHIPRLLNVVFYCLVKEESWNILKEFKNPTIDFKRLMYFSNAKTKELMPELF